MKTLELKPENRRSVVRKLNFSIGIFLFMFLILTTYLYISKNHYFFNFIYQIEWITGTLLVALTTVHYILFILVSRAIKVHLFMLIYRHLMNLAFIGWFVIAITSGGSIGLGEISALVNFFFLLELFHSSFNRSNIIHSNRKQLKQEVKKVFFSISVLMSVTLTVFYFIHDFRLPMGLLLINFLVFVLYSGMVLLNINLIYSFLFRKSLTDEVTE